MNETKTLTMQELIISRRSIFQFQDRPVPEAVIQDALEAARWAPNHKMTQPWRFVIPGPEMRLKLKAYFARRLEAKMRHRGFGEEEIAQRMSQPMPDIPVQIMVYYVRSGDELRQREDYAATCCAIQNLTLSAWAHGVASGWKTFDNSETYELFNLDPQEAQIVGLLQLGYPLRERGAQRRPLEEFVQYTD